MKQIILFASVMLSVTAFTQWDTGHYKGTEEPYKQQLVNGIYYIQEEMIPCEYVVEKDIDNDAWVVSIYPFRGSQKASWEGETYQDVVLINKSGEKTRLQTLCIDGMMLFYDDSFIEFDDFVREKGEYTVSMTHKKEEGHPSYRFTFKN